MAGLSLIRGFFKHSCPPSSWLGGGPPARPCDEKVPGIWKEERSNSGWLENPERLPPLGKCTAMTFNPSSAITGTTLNLGPNTHGFCAGPGSLGISSQHSTRLISVSLSQLSLHSGFWASQGYIVKL